MIMEPYKPTTWQRIKRFLGFGPKVGDFKSITTIKVLSEVKPLDLDGLTSNSLKDYDQKNITKKYNKK